MRKHRIFNKGEQIHCLLSSFNHPNILIPVKGIIKDYQWDEVNLRYLIKITKFYDSLPFLKKYLFDMNFYHSYEMKPKRFKLKDNEFKSVKEIEEAISGIDSDRYYLVVDSIMTTKTKVDLEKLFNKIQHFLISRHFKDLKELMTRTFYRDTMRLDSHKDFESRLYHFIGDLFEKDGKDFNWYVSSI